MGVVMGYHGKFPYCKKTGVTLVIVTVRARICRPFKEPRNRFSAWRNRFLGSLNVYKYGLLQTIDIFRTTFLTAGNCREGSWD
jgi:hypothetical protein